MAGRPPGMQGWNPGCAGGQPRRRRAAAAGPTRPRPSRPSEAGSGTGTVGLKAMLSNSKANCVEVATTRSNATVEEMLT